MDVQRIGKQAVHVGASALLHPRQFAGRVRHLPDEVWGAVASKVVVAPPTTNRELYGTPFTPAELRAGRSGGR